MLFGHKYHIKNIWKNHPFIYGLNFLYFVISCIMVETSVIAEVLSDVQRAGLLSFRVAAQRENRLTRDTARHKTDLCAENAENDWW